MVKCSNPILFNSTNILLRERIKRKSFKPKFPNQKSSITQSILKDTDYKQIKEKFLQRTRDLDPTVKVNTLPEIKSSFSDRFYKRYTVPSIKWFEKINWPHNYSFSSLIRYASSYSEEYWFKLFLNDKKDLFISWKHLQSTSLKIGDLVILSTNPQQLAICIDLPTDTKDPRYTFATQDGNIFFHTRNFVLLRIPFQLPSYFSKVKSLITEEDYSYEKVGKIKNNNIYTILPVLTRKILVIPLTKTITSLANSKTYSISKKLELLHRHLQSEDGPYQIPLSLLVNLVRDIDLSLCESKNFEETHAYINDLKLKINQSTTKKIYASDYLASYWCLKFQQQKFLWGDIHLSKASLSPISVTILPFNQYHVYYMKLFDEIQRNPEKHNALLKDFAECINNSKFDNIIDKYPKIILLLKNYCAGNFDNNFTFISLISKLLINCKNYQKSDVTKDLVKELLDSIFENDKKSSRIKSTYQINSLHENIDLALPNVSRRTKKHQTIYNLTEISPINDDKYTVDNNSKSAERYDFGGLKVYCIDSKTAHEIDDGVSIKKLSKNLFTVYVHIADPAAILLENNDLSFGKDILDIAASKSFTVYLPDKVSPMLPKALCRKADLGKDGQKTKTITFSVNVKLNDNTDDLEILYDTFVIRLGLLSSFPTNTTYNDVTNIINSDTNSLSSIDPDVKQDLENLFKVAKRLKNNRIIKDNAVIFGDGFNDGLVNVRLGKNGKADNIYFTNQSDSDSVTLVSELMILANTLTGRYFSKHNIPGVYRCYNELELGESASKEYHSLKENVKNGAFPSVKDINMMNSFLNSSFYSSIPLRHQMIGSNQYLTVTSPLRRFPDLINHLQLHSHLTKKPFHISPHELENYYLPMIQSRDIIINQAANKCNTYYTLQYLKQQIQEDPNKKFEVAVTTVPYMGILKCNIPGYKYSRGILKLKPTLKRIPMIGDVIKGCKIVEIDCLSGLLELEMDY